MIPFFTQAFIINSLPFHYNNKANLKSMQVKKLRFFISLFVIMFVNLLYGQKYGYQGTQKFGNSSFDVGNHIAVDQNGSVYSTGKFLYTVDFDPGPGVFNLNAIANEDAFILKLDSNGNFGWAKKNESKTFRT